jgi:hypothetical protein
MSLTSQLSSHSPHSMLCVFSTFVCISKAFHRILCEYSIVYSLWKNFRTKFFCENFTSYSTMYCTKGRTLSWTVFCDVGMFVPWQLSLRYITDWLFLKEEQGTCIQASPLKKTCSYFFAWSLRQSQPLKHFNIEHIYLYYDTRPLSHLIVNLW